MKMSTISGSLVFGFPGLSVMTAVLHKLNAIFLFSPISYSRNHGQL